MSSVQELVSRGFDETVASTLCARTWKPGEVLALQGAVTDWGELVRSCVDGEVRVLVPAGARWTSEEVREVLAAAFVSAEEGVAHVVLSDVDTLSGQDWDRLLKTLEGGPAVFWLCASSLGRVPSTIRSRCAIEALVVPVPDWVSLSELAGSQEEARRLLDGVHGDSELLAGGLKAGLTDALNVVASTSGRLLRSGDEVARFVDSFCQVATRSSKVSAAWDWSKLTDERKRVCRVYLIRWLGSAGVEPTDAESALLVNDLLGRYEQARTLIGRNVLPLHALSLLLAD